MKITVELTTDVLDLVLESITIKIKINIIIKRNITLLYFKIYTKSILLPFSTFKLLICINYFRFFYDL